VVINKIDLPEANTDKVKQQLAKYGVLVEGFGGDTVVMPVSAKTSKGIKELLDVILLIADMKEIKADALGEFFGITIEAKFDKKKGTLASIIVKNGTLKVGDVIYAEDIKCKVKQMLDDKGISIVSTNLSQPVVIMGWEKIPQVGAKVTAQMLTATHQSELKFIPKPFELPPLKQSRKLKLIIKTDVIGSLEAIKESLDKDVEIISATTGDITESDILIAKSVGAIIIGFNIKPGSEVLKLAATEKVKIKTYSIIYELLDEIKEVSELLKAPETSEEILGEAIILAEFKFDETRVAGCRVTSGKLARNDLVKINRKDIEIGKTRIKSLRHGKEDIPRADTAVECGLILDKKLDFKIGDIIIAYKVHELLA
jgi:translation initiation factor IF-2